MPLEVGHTVAVSVRSITIGLIFIITALQGLTITNAIFISNNLLCLRLGRYTEGQFRVLRSQHFLVGRLFRCRCCYKLRDRGLVANELGGLRLFGFFDFDEGFRKVLSFASEFLICFVNIDLSGTPTE